MSRAEPHDLWRRFVNPDYVALLETLGFGRSFVRAEGVRLRDEAGAEVLDFLAGYGVHNLGHNHPRVVATVRAALDSGGPSMLNVDAPLEAGRLAERLSQLTAPELCRTALANSGAEAVELAVRAARASTGRSALLSCAGGYHGLSGAAVSLMGALPGEPGTPAEQVPFGDLGALEAACGRIQPAAFVVEPVQAEGGVRIPDDSYLAEAARICRAAGCLLVVDEIQTGLGRTGRLFATDFGAVRPDALLLGKALSGGLVPAAAAVFTADVWKRAFGGPQRCVLARSTFAGGRLAMAAALETLAVLDEEHLAERAAELGTRLLARLRELAGRHGAVAEVRGRGLLLGIELAPPSGLLPRAVPEWARDGLHAQVLAARLLAGHGILTQGCSLAPRVLRVEPPLVVDEAAIDAFVSALDAVLAECPSASSAVLAAARMRVFGG